MALHEIHNALIKIFVIYPDGFELVGHLIAQNALHDIQIVVQQRRCGLLLRFLADVQPEAVKEAHVRGDFLFGDALAGGADNKATRCAFTMRLQNTLKRGAAPLRWRLCAKRPSGPRWA